MLEDTSFNLNSDRWKAEFPNGEARFQFLNMACKVTPLEVYCEWVVETRAEAREADV